MRLQQGERRQRWVVPVVGLALFCGLVAARSEGLVALVLPAGICVGVLAALTRVLTREVGPAEQRRVMAWTMGAFAAHLGFGLVVSNVATLTRYLGGDALTYHGLSTQLLHHWTQGVAPPFVPAGKEGFYYVLASLYWVFGVHMSAGLVVNAAAAAALVPLVTDTTRRAMGEEAARYVAPMVVLLPGLFIWTSQLLKEAGILLFLAVAANCASRIVNRVTPAPLLGLAASVTFLFTFRGWVALVVLCGFLLGVVLGRHALFAGLSTGLTVAALVALLVLGVGLGSSGYRKAVGSNLEQATMVRQDLAQSAQSGYGGAVDTSTPARALSYLPTGLIALGLGPFPWQVTSVRQLPALLDVSVWWMLIPSLLRGLGVARRKLGREWLLYLLPAATTSVLLALAIGNFGTVVRERMQVVVLLVPIIALGLAERARRRQPALAPVPGATAAEVRAPQPA